MVYCTQYDYIDKIAYQNLIVLLLRMLTAHLQYLSILPRLATSMS